MTGTANLFKDRYEIINYLKSGGMGSVYLAKDLRLAKYVVLKETQYTDARLVKAFENEAQLLASLRHPMLPVVTDYFSEHGRYFLAMDYIEGEDLEEMLKERRQKLQPIGENKPFNVDEVLSWAEQLLELLDYLHTQQAEPIIHRDIKPANIKLNNRNKIILLDFGLAKGKPSGQLTEVDMQNSIVAATPQYAPIEQLRGAGTDAQSDIYSLGATLFTLITGSYPADAATRSDAVDKGKPDPLRRADEINPHVPKSIADVLGYAMQLNKEDRPASAMAMLRMLREAKRLADVEWQLTQENEKLKRQLAIEIENRKHEESRNQRLHAAIIEIKKREQKIIKEFEQLVQDVTGRLSEGIQRFTQQIEKNKGISESKDEWEDVQTYQKKSEEHLSDEDLAIIKSLESSFTSIKPGEFLMGSEQGGVDQKPVHRVIISGPFEIGKYQVTQKQWNAVASLPKIKLNLNPTPSYFEGEDLPVEQVTWEEVTEFCARLSRMTGRKYRLPTEAEWEYACRAGSTEDYAGNPPELGWLLTNSDHQTHPVGQKKPNAWGIYDMHGNVWEWCADWYAEDYYNRSPIADPTGPRQSSKRVRRGGGWNCIGSLSSSAIRGQDSPDTGNNTIGFRLVRSVD